MKLTLIPKEEKFFELFELQAEHNLAAARLFHEMAKRWPARQEEIDKLHAIEHEADITAHEIHDRLNRTFITPLDREDIHALASELDDIVDLVQHVALRMHLYRIEEPTPELIDLSDTLRQAVDNVRKAVVELGKPEKIRRTLDYCIEVNRLENTADRIMEAALAKLFGGRPGPLEVIKWKEVYEGIEAAIDKCEDVANTIESILVKQG